MKKFRLLVLTTTLAMAALAEAREWKSARVVDSTETDVSSKAWGEKSTIHYTIETDDMIYFADYSYKPGHGANSHVPDLAVTQFTKIAIEGRHAYILDVAGKEVKMHITKKTSKK
jgi:hypothetical protein